jgi:hypothetical protein
MAYFVMFLAYFVMKVARFVMFLAYFVMKVACFVTFLAYFVMKIARFVMFLPVFERIGMLRSHLNYCTSSGYLLVAAFPATPESDFYRPSRYRSCV